MLIVIMVHVFCETSDVRCERVWRAGTAYPRRRAEKCQLSQRVMPATFVQEASQPKCGIGLTAWPEILHVKVGTRRQLAVLEREVSGPGSLHALKKLCHATEIVLKRPETAERRQPACEEGKTTENSLHGSVHEAGGQVPGANQSQVRQLVVVPGRCRRRNGGRSVAPALEACAGTRASALPAGRLMIVRRVLALGP